MTVRALLVWVSISLTGTGWAQQIETEDLAPPPSAAPVAAPDFAPQLEEAELLFASANQPDALPLLDQLIATLEVEIADENALAALQRSLALRAQVHFNLGDRAAAGGDLERLLILDPGFGFDPALASPKLVQLSSEIAARMVGQLRLSVDPPDATVSIGGQEVDPSQPVSRLAGTAAILASRPGFAPVSQDVTIQPGVTTEVPLSLTRTSAVLWIRTRPVGVEVTIDGKRVGTTGAGDEPGVSAPLAAEVAVGTRSIEATLADHRPQRMTVNVPSLGDYRLEPLSLERAAANVKLLGLPPGARLLVDGRSTEARGDTLAVAPGRRRIAVDGGPRGQFERTLDLADRQQVELTVALRPALSFDGLLGGDRQLAERTAGELAGTFASLTSWAVLDRAAEGARVLGRLGVDASVLRNETSAARLDWAAVQKGLDALSPASLHVIAALSDDLVASSVELVLLPSAPAVPRPDRRRLTLGSPESATSLLTALDRPLLLSAPVLGLEVVDGLEGPTVTTVRAGSAAEAAGIRAGEVLSALNGQPVASRNDFFLRLHGGGAGRLRLALRGPAGPRELELEVPIGPASVRPDSDGQLGSALAARVGVARAAGSAPSWVLDLTEGIALLAARDFDGAIRRLRATEAPSGPGLGREAVDYWLGVALSAASPDYRAAAKEAFERAARRPDATFDHGDGPFVAPAARARAAAL
jgi:hypothetical protein